MNKVYSSLIWMIVFIFKYCLVGYMAASEHLKEKKKSL